MMKIWLVVALFAFEMNAEAQQQTESQRQAKQIFDKVYGEIFHGTGVSLSYSINIIGIYKTTGSIWYKGEKSKFVEKKSTVWCDGKTYVRAFHSKKLVEIYDADSPDRDMYSTKFTFDPKNYIFDMKTEGNHVVVSMDAKPGVDGIKHAKAVLNKKTLVPKVLKIKLLWFWTSVTISNYKKGAVSDDLFVFPKENYKDWKIVDKRENK